MKQDLFDPINKPANFDFTPFKEAQKSIRRTLITAAAVNVGCLLISVAGVTCVILGCLKLFGVI